MAASDPCRSAFTGLTPNNPVSKVADKSSAYAGQQVTFTISFTATGAKAYSVTDCFRVDGGHDATLNSLVTGFNVTYNKVANLPKGQLVSIHYTITIPSDASLVGHSIVDRAKAPQGSVESRSALVSVAIVAPPGSGGTTTGSTTGTTTGSTTGSTTGTTTGGTVVQGTTLHHTKTSVKGATLAHTGPVSAKAAFLGSLMIMIGLASRIRRPQLATSVAEAADNSGSSYLARYDSFVQAALRRSSH